MNKLPEVLFAEDRKRKIVELVNENGKATVSALCAVFEVSSATIRNDLRELEDAGALRRTHGGAINNRSIGYELTTHEKEVKNVEKKRAIAREALRFIQPGDSIAIDTGTTTFELAKLIAGIDHLSVVTNDLQIAFYLARNTSANIIVAGGQVRKNFHCTVGEAAIGSIRHLHVDKVFAAANGVHLHNGLTTHNMEMASFKRQILGLADEVFVLADSSKLNTSAFISFAPMSQVDVLITDGDADEGFIESAKQLGLDVVCAESERNK